ncbi:hypothetical protein Chor_012730 [Crotalus horridus]
MVYKPGVPAALLPSHSPLPKADAHQTLPDKGALAGKRDAAEDLYSVGQESVDQRVIGRLLLQMSEESMQQ